jgi:hypothetical protein
LIAGPAAALLITFAAATARAEDTSRQNAIVILENGDSIQATCVEPSSLDIVRITTPDGKYQYMSFVRIDAVIDESGADRTRYVLDRRKRIGTPLPKAPSLPGPGLRVGPKSVTSSFWITETTVLGRVGGSDRSRRALGGRFDFDLGHMSNVGERTAVGGTMFVGSANDYTNAGLRVHVRRWLSRTASVDIAPGIIAFEHSVGGTVHPPGFSIRTSLNPSRYISFTAEVFNVGRSEYRHNGIWYASVQNVRDTGVMVGGKVGQWPGAVVGSLAVLSFGFLSGSNSIR